jgi:hypothetical protein
VKHETEEVKEVKEPKKAMKPPKNIANNKITNFLTL